MTSGHMSDLMGHNSRQFSFVIRFQNQSRVHKEESSRERERIYYLGIDHLDSERHLGIRVAHEVLTYTVDVLRDNGVVDDLGLTLDFLSHLLPHRDLLLQ